MALPRSPDWRAHLHLLTLTSLRPFPQNSLCPVHRIRIRIHICICRVHGRTAARAAGTVVRHSLDLAVLCLERALHLKVGFALALDALLLHVADHAGVHVLGGRLAS